MAEIVEAQVGKVINYLDPTLFFDPRFAQPVESSGDPIFSLQLPYSAVKAPGEDAKDFNCTLRKRDGPRYESLIPVCNQNDLNI